MFTTGVMFLALTAFVGPVEIDSKNPSLPPLAKARLGSLYLAEVGGFASTCLSKDGKLLVTGSGGAFQIWDLTHKKRLQYLGLEKDLGLDFQDTLGSVHLLRFLDSESTLLGCTESGHFVWDLPNRKLVYFEKHQPKWITVSALSTNGKWLVHGDRKGAIVLHDLDAKTQVRFPDKHAKKEISALAVSPDGKRIASGDTDGVTLLWNTQTQKSIQLGPTHMSNLSSDVLFLLFSPDGSHLFSTCDDRVIRKWNVGEPAKNFEILVKAKYPANALALTPDGKKLAWVEESICLLDLRTGKKIPEKQAQDSPIGSLSFSADGRFVSGIDRSTANVVEVDSMRPHFVRIGHSAEITSMVFHSNGKEVITNGDDGRLLRWKSDGSFIAPVKLDGKFRDLPPLAHSRSLLAAVDKDDVIHLWETAGFRRRSRIVAKEFTHATALSTDGKLLISAHAIYEKGATQEKTVVKVFDSGTTKLLKELPTELPDVLKLRPSPDGEKILVRGRHKTLLINRLSGKVDFSYEHPILSYPQFAGEFTKDGKQFLINDGLQDLWLRDSTTGKKTRTLYERHLFQDKLVTAFTISADGKTVAVAINRLGSMQSLIELWSVEQWKVVHTLEAGNAGKIQAICFSEDGALLGTGGSDTTALIWDIKAIMK